MTRRFATASAGGTGTGRPSRIAVGKGVRLDGVRVGSVEGQGLGVRRDRRIASGRDEDASGPVRGDVERDLDRDPPGVP